MSDEMSDEMCWRIFQFVSIEDYSSFLGCHPKDAWHMEQCTPSGYVPIPVLYCRAMGLPVPRRPGEHGGSRPGAGRPARKKKPASRVRSVRLTPEEDRYYAQFLEPGESWSTYLRRLLEHNAVVEEHRRKQAQQGKE